MIAMHTRTHETSAWFFHVLILNLRKFLVYLVLDRHHFFTVGLVCQFFYVCTINFPDRKIVNIKKSGQQLLTIALLSSHQITRDY